MKLPAPVPVLLLLVSSARHFAWQAWPNDARGMASKMLGSLAALALIWLVYWLAKAALPRSRWLLPVALLYSFEEAITALASAAYMIEPWPLKEGEGIASSWAGVDLGAISIMVFAFLAIWMSVNDDKKQ